MFNSKKVFSYLISIAIAVVAIYLLQPTIEAYQNKNKYHFEVSSENGPLNNDSFKGKVLAVYFGYTFCPDVCPTSLSSLAMALNEFPKKRSDKLKGLFISVDPDRDKLKELNEYAAYFHPNFIGGTSNKENIDDITKRFGTFYEKVYLKDSKMDYSVSHTSFIYIFDTDGNYVDRIDHFSDPAFIKSVLEKVL